MQVEAIQKKIIDIELSDDTIKEIVIEKFCEVFDINIYHTIENGNLINKINNCEPFYPLQLQFIRTATKTDKAAVKLLSQLMKEL